MMRRCHHSLHWGPQETKQISAQGQLRPGPLPSLGPFYPPGAEVQAQAHRLPQTHRNSHDPKENQLAIEYKKKPELSKLVTICLSTKYYFKSTIKCNSMLTSLNIDHIYLINSDTMWGMTTSLGPVPFSLPSKAV